MDRRWPPLVSTIHVPLPRPLTFTAKRFSAPRAESDPKLAQLGWGTGFVVTVMAISLLIPLLLWFLIARRASNIAKWVLVIFTVPGLFFLPSSAEQMSTSAFVLTWVLTAIQLAAISFLFKRDAREWLSPTAEEEDGGFKRGVNLK